MNKILTCCLLLLISVKGFGQKITPYNYGDVDTILQFQDAQIIVYDDKKGKHRSDTIWHAKQKKEIAINWAHIVITDSRYLKPRLKFKKH